MCEVDCHITGLDKRGYSAEQIEHNWQNWVDGDGPWDGSEGTYYIGNSWTSELDYYYLGGAFGSGDISQAVDSCVQFCMKHRQASFVNNNKQINES